MTHKEKALDYFSRHFHCSQAVLAAFAPECGGCLGRDNRGHEQELI